jgi:hypothetical protein
MNEILKCKICKYSYNLEVREPIVIKCGHTFCKCCIVNKSNDNTCPLCGINVNFKLENCAINSFAEEVLRFLENDSKKDSSKNIQRIDIGKRSKEGSPVPSKSDNKLSSYILNGKNLFSQSKIKLY